MFAALVPGLRDLRSPLACGLLWLLAAWFAIARQSPDVDSEEAPQLVREIWRLVEPLGTPGVVAVVTFVAYLAGVVLSVQLSQVYRALSAPALAMTRPMVQLMLKLPAFRGLANDYDYILESQSTWKIAGSLTAMREADSDKLHKLALTRLHEAERAGVSPAEVLQELPRTRELLESSITVKRREGKPKNLWELVRGASDSLDEDLQDAMPRAAQRLMLKHPSVHSEYDREITEASFRYALTIPLIALTAALLSYIPGFYSAVTLGQAFVFVAALYAILTIMTVRGLQSTFSANDLLVVTILDDPNIHPILFSWDQQIMAAKAAPAQPTPEAVADKDKNVFFSLFHRNRSRRAKETRS
ncbi:hypothetical protein [Clavibacter michiganensis]|uniref:hypothetical protein n=1 Tax=Clavibacter michiganensis TaxID=28447 RepID=UPI003EBDC583